MAFTGRAIYSSGVFNGVMDDVSDDISMISPYETPLLDVLAQPDREATNVLHEWLEESLGPNTVVSSTSIDATVTGMAVHDGSGNAVTGYLQAGMILKGLTSGEYVQITGISGNTVTITRGFGGTTAATVAQQTWYMVSDAALEGADVAGDISVPRSRKSNYCQIFKKDIIVSGTVQSVTHLGGIDDEYEHQRMQRLRESIRDLEKAVIQGITSGNTIGTSTLYRTFNGLWKSITTNTRTDLATITSVEQIEDVIGLAWNRGADDLDLIIVDSTKKRQLAALQSPRIEVHQGQDGGTIDSFHKDISFIETTYGRQAVLRSRWMPANSMIVTSSQRVRVVPLKGRSFAHVPVAQTGDAQKGMIIGEYTLEVKNEDGMAKAS
jgi:hypothetical protein